MQIIISILSSKPVVLPDQEMRLFPFQEKGQITYFLIPKFSTKHILSPAFWFSGELGQTKKLRPKFCPFSVRRLSGLILGKQSSYLKCVQASVFWIPPIVEIVCDYASNMSPQTYEKHNNFVKLTVHLKGSQNFETLIYEKKKQKKTSTGYSGYRKSIIQ